MDDIAIVSLRGGQNDSDPAQNLNDDECVTATDVEFFASALGERRLGTATLSLTSSGLTAEAGIVMMSQWFPTNVVTLPEYIFVAATPGVSASAARRDTSGTWHVLTPNDAIVNTAPDIFQIVTQALDGNDFIAYRSAQDRMHLWDTSNWRRAGLAQPAAPTAANTGSGAYSGKRYFRVRYTIQSGGKTLVRSEPSLSLTFVPSGTGAAARVTKPASISENETHWEIEASEDNANYYQIGTVAVGTTTFDDTTASSKTFPTLGVSLPVSTDGTSITYVLLSDQAAALNLTGTVSNGSYGNPGGTISGRGWIGYTSGNVYIPSFPSTWSAGQQWFASPDVEVALEAQASGNSGNYAAVGTLSEAIGAYLPMPAAKYLAVDGDRLIYAGHETDVTRQSTVGWTPVKSDPGVGNSERAPIVTTGGLAINTTRDLDNYDGGAITGLAATSFGSWYAFKWQRVYNATRQQNVVDAYDIQTVSSTRGAIQGSVVRATDVYGFGAIFFLDPFVGPCRMASGGVITPIHGLRTTWKRINTKATNLVACGQYYPYKQQVQWFVSVDGGNTPTLCICIQTDLLKQRPTGELGGGVSYFTGKRAQAQCAAALTFTVGNQTTDFPFVGLVSPDFAQRCDTGTDDNGTAFSPKILSKPMFQVGLMNQWGIRNASLLATAAASNSVTLSLVRDEGLETHSTAAASLAAVGSETQVIKDFDDLVMSEARSIQIQLADGVTGQNWQVQRVDLKPRLEETS